MRQLCESALRVYRLAYHLMVKNIGLTGWCFAAKKLWELFRLRLSTVRSKRMLLTCLVQTFGDLVTLSRPLKGCSSISTMTLKW